MWGMFGKQVLCFQMYRCVALPPPVIRVSPSKLVDSSCLSSLNTPCTGPFLSKGSWIKKGFDVSELIYFSYQITWLYHADSTLTPQQSKVIRPSEECVWKYGTYPYLSAILGKRLCLQNLWMTGSYWKELHWPPGVLLILHPIIWDPTPVNGLMRC